MLAAKRRNKKGALISTWFSSNRQKTSQSRKLTRFVGSLNVVCMGPYTSRGCSLT